MEQYFLTISNEYASCFNKGTSYSPKEIIDTFFTFYEKYIDSLRLLQKSYLPYYLLEQSNLILPVVYDTVRGGQGIYQIPLEKKIVLSVSTGALWNILSEWFQVEERFTPERISEAILMAIERNRKGHSSP